MTPRMTSIISCLLVSLGCSSGSELTKAIPLISPKVTPRFGVTALEFLKEAEDCAKLADVKSDEDKFGAETREMYDVWAVVPDNSTADPMQSLWVSCRMISGESRSLRELRQAAKTDPGKEPELAQKQAQMLEAIARIRKAIANGEALRLTELPSAEAPVEPAQ